MMLWEAHRVEADEAEHDICSPYDPWSFRTERKSWRTGLSCSVPCRSQDKHRDGHPAERRKSSAQHDICLEASEHHRSLRVRSR